MNLATRIGLVLVADRWYRAYGGRQDEPIPPPAPPSSIPLSADRINCYPERPMTLADKVPFEPGLFLADTSAAQHPDAFRQESDPHGIDQHAPGAKLDNGKVMPWLCFSGFSRALAAVADVTSKGARKYTPNGWMSVPDGEARYMEAFARHMLALGRGETIDPDTGCMHKAQMIWNLLASMELEMRAAEGWAKKPGVTGREGATP